MSRVVTCPLCVRHPPPPVSRVVTCPLCVRHTPPPCVTCCNMPIVCETHFLCVTSCNMPIVCVTHQPAIQHALERVCSLFPDTIRAECTSFVDNYAAAVINLLVQEIQPDRICKLLNLCPKDAQGTLSRLVCRRHEKYDSFCQ